MNNNEAISYSLLPNQKTFAQLFFPFALPYFAYVAIGSIPISLLANLPNPLAIIRLSQFLTVAFLLWTFRKNYRFGPALIPKQISICLIGSILAIILWIYLLGIFTPDSHKIRSLEDLSSNFQFSQNIFASINSAWILRAINSTFLVPIFEELFCRIFLLEFFQGLSWPFKSVSHRIDQKPQFLSRPPLSWISVIATSTFFMVGHSLSAWPAAFIYFVLTCMIYKLTLSLRGCILVHAIANGAIAVFVIFFPSMGYLW